MHARGTGRIAVFLHKPVYVETPDEPENAYWAIPASARGRLLDLAEGGNIAAFSSGHLHQGLIRQHAGTHHVWVPATTNAAREPPTHGALLMTGAAVWDFEPGRFRVRFVTS